MVRWVISRKALYAQVKWKSITYKIFYQGELCSLIGDSSSCANIASATMVYFIHLPMQSFQIFLGRPWKYDRSTKNDGRTNWYSLTLNGWKLTLYFILPSQVNEAYERLRELKVNGMKVGEEKANEGEWWRGMVEGWREKSNGDVG